MTRVNRRQLLLGGGALIAAPAILRRAAAAPAPAELVVGEADAVLLDGGGPARLWAFNGASPGPLLRVRKGGEVAVRLRNGLAEGTSIHWHGIRIDNAMDGVVHLTQPPVGEGETFDYRFTAPDAGTFWYHPHTHESWRQVSMGLYGVLVVEEDEPVDVDHDVVMVVDDWRVREDGGLDTESLGNFHDAAHFGRLGNILTVNGKPFEALEFPAGSRLRLRLVSTATARILRLALDGGEAWVVARDGQPVAVRELAGTMVLSPGQRIDLVLDVTGDPGAAITLSEVTGETPLAAARIVVAEGTGSRRAAPPEALPGNLVALPRDFDPRQSVDLVMEGGAMRFLEKVMVDGQEMDGRTAAVEHGQFWAFNGIAGMGEEPLFRTARDRTIEIRMVNRTAFPHAIHLHGHHFVETFRASGDVNEGLFDTVLLDAEEQVAVAFVADNPGKWMIHCHMLDHQASGMMSWFEVA